MSEATLREQSESLVTLMARLMRRLFTIDTDDPAMEIPGAQMRVCTFLSDGPRAMSSLSNELGITQSAITQIADRLERVGMVERIPGTDDRRCKMLSLTEHGIGAMQARREKRIARAMKVLDTLSAEERQAALDALDVLLNAIQTEQ